MLRRKKTKIAALLLSIFILFIVPFNFNPYDVGLYENCPLHCRLLFHFFHANFIHAFLNVWCFLSCVFLAEMSISQILIAYIIACTVPFMADLPTIGLSGVCYALLGNIMIYSKSKINFNCIILISILVPYVLMHNSVNSELHGYCYICGIIARMIMKLIKCRKR